MEKGDLFTLTTGTYSDYEVINTHRALRDFTMFDIRSGCIADGVSGRSMHMNKATFDTRKVEEWMIKNGYCDRDWET